MAAKKRKRETNHAMAKKQVEAFLITLEEKTGLTQEELLKIPADLSWLRSAKKRYELIGAITAGVIITSIVGAILMATWEGFRVLLGRHA